MATTKEIVKVDRAAQLPAGISKGIFAGEMLAYI